MIHRLVLVFLAVFAVSASARDWTRFRGPNGSGISEATTVPVQWTEADYNWRITLPGNGISSPVIWENKLFITSADTKRGERFLQCIDTENGETLWQQSFAFTAYRKHRNNTFATNTPVVDADKVYVLWQSAEGSALHALSHDGKPVWRADLGSYKSGHGTGSSPIVFDGMVVICNDHDGDNSFLIALDKTNGNVRWRIPRIGDRACYSTPCVFQVPGREAEIIFTHSYRGITGVDPESGKKNWEIDVFGRHKQRAVASPVIFDDLVIGSSGFTTAEKNVVAVRPTGTDTGSEVEEVYRVSRLVPHVPTPVVYRKWLFMVTDTGILTCTDAASGLPVWHERLGGNFQSSPICVSGRLYCIDLDGVLSVVAASDRFELLAQNEFGESTRATPAVSGGVMYVRTETQLFSIGGE